MGVVRVRLARAAVVAAASVCGCVCGYMAARARACPAVVLVAVRGPGAAAPIWPVGGPPPAGTALTVRRQRSSSA